MPFFNPRSREKIMVSSLFGRQLKLGMASLFFLSCSSEYEIQAEKPNVNPGDVKHEAIHMHVRRKVTQCSTTQRNAKIQSNPRTPGNSEIPGTGNPTKDPGEPGLRVASAIGPLRKQMEGGERNE